MKVYAVYPGIVGLDEKTQRYFFDVTGKTDKWQNGQVLFRSPPDYASKESAKQAMREKVAELKKKHCV